MRHLDLFSGIGGFALAADWVWPGIEHTFCEIDPFCRNVLNRHWPDSKIYGDIRELLSVVDEKWYDGSLCEQRNKEKQISETWRLLSKRLDDLKSQENAEIAGGLESTIVVKLGGEEESSAVTNVDTHSRGVLKGQMLEVELGCVESPTRIGSTETDTMEGRDMTQKSPDGEEESSKETNLPVRNAESDRKESHNSTHITLSRGSDIQNSGLSFQTELPYVSNATRKLIEEEVDLLTAGFPCQPFSNAGKRRGEDDDRYFWPETIGAIRAFRPRYCVLENVRGLLSQKKGMVFEQIIADLEDEHYEVWPFVLPACGVNAPHRRERVWIVGRRKDGHDPEGERRDHGDSEDQRQAAGEIDASGMSGGDAADTCRPIGGGDNHGKVRDQRRESGGAGTEGIQSKDRAACADHAEQGGVDAAHTPCEQRERSREKMCRRSEHTDRGGDAPDPEGERKRPEQGTGGADVQRGERMEIGKERSHSFDRNGWLRDWRKVCFDTCAEIVVESEGYADSDDDGEPIRKNLLSLPAPAGHDRMDDGLPGRMVRLTDGSEITQAKYRREALKAYGNAIVPQVAEQIFTAIREMDTWTH